LELTPDRKIDGLDQQRKERRSGQKNILSSNKKYFELKEKKTEKKGEKI